MPRGRSRRNVSSSVASPSNKPGMLGPIAGGVVLGHIVGGTLMGRCRCCDDRQVPEQPMSNQQENSCDLKLQQFAECAQNHSNSSPLSSSGNQVSEQPLGHQQQSNKLSESDQKQQHNNLCQLELQQFVDCAQNESDISYCQGVRDVFKQCKLQYGKNLYALLDRKIAQCYYLSLRSADFHIYAKNDTKTE